MEADRAQPERLGDGVREFQQATLNGNQLIQEIRGTLAAFLNGQYVFTVDSPLGKFHIKVERAAS